MRLGFDDKGPIPSLDLLLSVEGIIRKRYASFGVPFPEDNWIAQSFNLIRTYQYGMLSSFNVGSRNRLLEAFITCWEVGTSLSGIVGDEDIEICREKLSLLLKHTSSSSTSRKTSPAKDTLFELALLSNMKRKGVDLNARLGLKNPDILVSADGVNYYLECKRISSQGKNALQRNVHNSSKQLVRNLPANTQGVIAISIGGYLFQDSNFVLAGKTEADASKQLSELLNHFVTDEVHKWRNSNVVDEKVAGIIFYISVLMDVEDREIPTQFAYTLLSDATIHSKSGSTFFQFYNSFSRLLNENNGRSESSNTDNFITGP